MRAVDVALTDVRARDERQQKSLFRTTLGLPVKEALRPREPTTGSRRLAPRQQVEHQPEGAACRTSDVVQPQPFRVCTRPEVRAGLVLPQHVRRDRESFEIFYADLRMRFVGDRQCRVRFLPVLPRECLASRRKPVGHHFSPIMAPDAQARKRVLPRIGSTSLLS